MENLTRRGVLIGGSALLPFAAMPSALLGQSPVTTASQLKKSAQAHKFNTDFVNYSAEALARGTAARKIGTATATDYKSMPQNVKMLANHFEKSGLDAGFKDPRFQQWASDAGTQSAFAKAKISVLSSDALAGVKSYAPSLTEYDFCTDPTAVYTTDDFNRGVAILSQHGISHYFRAASDMLHASAPAAATLSPTKFNSHNGPILQYPNYVVGSASLMHNTASAFCSKKYKASDVCQFLVAVGAALAGINLGVGCAILAAIFAPAGLAIGIGCVLGAGLIALVSAYLALNCTAES